MAPIEVMIPLTNHDLRLTGVDKNPFIVTPSSTCSTFNHDDSENENDSTLGMQVAIRLRPLQPLERTHCIELASRTTTLLSHRNDGTNSDTSRPHFLPKSDRDDDSVWPRDPSPCQVLVRSSSKHEKQKFTFDHAFSSSIRQENFYIGCVSRLVRSCVYGYNATVFAYGQTGSGKTYTIMGPPLSAELQKHQLKKDNKLENDKADILSREAGVIPRAVRELFDRLEKKKLSSDRQNPAKDGQSRPRFEFQIKIRVLEVYGEVIRDLLASSQNERLVIRDGGIGEDAEVFGAREVEASSAGEALALLNHGISRRVTGSTAMNSASSRSHVIFTTMVEQKSKTSSNGCDDFEKAVAEVAVKTSKFHFVDLAGSERATKAGTKGKRLKEGIDINKGLLVLGNVISALADPKKRGRTHIPYRESKLTRLLKGSLGGNHKTLMIACVSPSLTNCDESINTLRYANRAKNIQNHAVVNVDPTSKAMAEMRFQVTALAAELLRLRNGNNDGLYCGDNDTEYCFTKEQLQSLTRKGDSSISVFSQGASTQTLAQQDAMSRVSFPDLLPSCQSSIASSTSTLSSAGKLIRSLQELHELLIKDHALSTCNKSCDMANLESEETPPKRIVDETRKNCSLNDGHDSRKKIDSLLEDILATLSKKDQFQTYKRRGEPALPMSEITIERNATLYPSHAHLDHTIQFRSLEEAAQHSADETKLEVVSNNAQHCALGEDVADDVVVQLQNEIAQVSNPRNKSAINKGKKTCSFLESEFATTDQAKRDAERIATLEEQLERMALQKDAADKALRAKEAELNAVLVITKFDYEDIEKKNRSLRQKEKKKRLSNKAIPPDQQIREPSVNFDLMDDDDRPPQSVNKNSVKRSSKKEGLIGSFFMSFLRTILRQQQQQSPTLEWEWM